MPFRMSRRRGQASHAPATTVPAAEPARPVDGVEVPYGVRFAAAWSWRLLLVAGAVFLLLQLFSLLSVVLVPVVISLLLAAVASPFADRLERAGVPRGIGTAVVVVGGLVVLAGLVALITQQVSSGFGELRRSFSGSLDEMEQYLVDLGLSRGQLQDLFARAREGFASGDATLSETLRSAGTTAGHVVAGLFIALFATVFFVLDGRGIWSWMVRLFPRAARERVDGSGVRAWAVLTSYVRATFLIALADAIGIAAVAAILQLPLVLPIGVLVFLGAFVPIVGATISGSAAVAVALVSEGPVSALIMLAGVIGVQQVESHVLQPFLMGRLVRVHPLAVVLVIAIGGLTAGIFGALIAVPLAAMVNSVGTYLAGTRDPAHDEGGALTPEEVGT